MKRRPKRVRGPRGMMIPIDAAPDWVNPPDGTTAKPVDRKLMQLCSQVAETLDMVLADQEDDALRDLQVHEVLPAPDGSNLLVTVRSLAPGADPIVLLSKLAEASADLRIEVASAITRRRAPSFTFRVVPT